MVAPQKKKGDKLELGGRDSNEKDHARKGRWGARVGGAGGGRSASPRNAFHVARMRSQ